MPGLCGYEAGQSGVGDIFGWFVDQGVPPAYHEAARAARGSRCTSTCRTARAASAVGEHGLVALDWHSGNRSVLVDHELSGMIVGLTLSTRPEEVYRALLEATAFGDAQDHRVLRGGRAAGARSSSSPAACSRTRS